MSRGDVDGHGLHTAGGVESRETDAHGETAFSVAGGLVRLTSDHEGIIVCEQLQPLTLWLVSLPISRQRLNSPTVAKNARDCLKTGPGACWQVDTFSGHLTGARSPYNNIITSV